MRSTHTKAVRAYVGLVDECRCEQEQENGATLYVCMYNIHATSVSPLVIFVM